MSSETPAADTGFVWIWLPGADEPVVAGRVDRRAGRFIFGYGRSYLDRDDAIPIYAPELPLRPGVIEPPDGLVIANCLLDAGPDSWGRRVIINRLLGPAATDDVDASWDEICDQAHMTDAERAMFRRVFPHRYALEGLSG